MTDTKDIEILIEKSFLARVPAILSESPEMSIEDAIQRAYDEEEVLCLDILKDGAGYHSERGSLAVKVLSERVYNKIREDQAQRNLADFQVQATGSLLI